MKTRNNKTKAMKCPKKTHFNEIPGESLSGTPSYHFRFVVVLNHVPRSIVRCDSVSRVEDPNFNIKKKH